MIHITVEGLSTWLKSNYQYVPQLNFNVTRFFPKRGVTVDLIVQQKGNQPQ